MVNETTWYAHTCVLTLSIKPNSYCTEQRRLQTSHRIRVNIDLATTER